MRETLDSSSPSPEEGQGQDRRRRRTRPSSFRFGKSAILVGLALLLVVAAIPAYNYYRTFVEPLQEVIVKVNDTQFTLADYIKRLRYLEQESALTGLNVDYSVDPFRLLQDFQRTELIKQASPREGITVNDEEIHQELRERLGAVPKEGEQITEEELERSFQEIYKQRLAQLKLSDAEYRDIIRELVRKDKLRDHLSDRVPTVAEHVRVLALKVEDPPRSKPCWSDWSRARNGALFAGRCASIPICRINAAKWAGFPGAARTKLLTRLPFRLLWVRSVRPSIWLPGCGW